MIAAVEASTEEEAAPAARNNKTRNLTSLPPAPTFSRTRDPPHTRACKQIDTFSMSNATRVSHASLETASSGANDPSKDPDESPQQVLRLRWDADANTPGGEEECTVPVARLRQHCSSETARFLRRQLGTMTGVEIPDPTSVLWGNGVLSSSAPGNSSIRFEYKEVMEGNQQSSSSAASQLRGALKSHGLALVQGVPVESAATQALGLKMGGRLMSTLFGDTVWGISIEALDPATSFRDVAYTTGGLQLHTDQSYMSEPPGLHVRQIIGRYRPPRACVMSTWYIAIRGWMLRFAAKVYMV